jgi:hypothetical protein
VALIAEWRGRLAESGFTRNPLHPDDPPTIALRSDSTTGGG